MLNFEKETDQHEINKLYFFFSLLFGVTNITYFIKTYLFNRIFVQYGETSYVMLELYFVAGYVRGRPLT